jgi:hypothetical protein
MSHTSTEHKLSTDLSLDCVLAQISFLLGDILTIIDASISGEQQNKAIKDIIKQKFSTRQDWITKLSYNELDNQLPVTGKTN